MATDYPVPPEPPDRSYVVVRLLREGEPLLALYGRDRELWRHDGYGAVATWEQLVDLDENHSPIVVKPVGSERTPSNDLWLELARAITGTERSYEKLAAQCWQSLDVTNAVRYRGIVDGLGQAREHMLRMAAESREAAS